MDTLEPLTHHQQPLFFTNTSWNRVAAFDAQASNGRMAILRSTLAKKRRMPMLTKVYANNYKCLVNFELELDRSISVFLGRNGDGKSTVFDLLQSVQFFAGFGLRTNEVFFANTLTRWLPSKVQRFSIEARIDEKQYVYDLTVSFGDDPDPVVLAEQLRYSSGEVLVSADNGDVRLFTDDSQLAASYPLNPFLSVIALLPQRAEYLHIQRFGDFLRQMIIVQLNPPRMNVVSEREEPLLNRRSENFISWYRHLSQDQGLVIQIARTLEEVLDGFSHLQFVKLSENNRGLQVFFRSNGDNRPVDYKFYELSDGQRALLALYCLLEFTKAGGCTLLCVDEPENFVALPEIQPWLMTLHDYSLEHGFQSILISHHPEFIDYFAAENGIWFERQPNSPVRVRRLDAEDGGLPISELVARGWIDG